MLIYDSIFTLVSVNFTSFFTLFRTLDEIGFLFLGYRYCKKFRYIRAFYDKIPIFWGFIEMELPIYWGLWESKKTNDGRFPLTKSLGGFLLGLEVFLAQFLGGFIRRGIVCRGGLCRFPQTELGVI